jgi:hypothetical protein
LTKYFSTNRAVLFLICSFYFLYRTANSFFVDIIFDEYDSPNYFNLSFFPSLRTHGITIFFSLIKNQFAISLFQASVGALAWIYLWISILRQIRSRNFKIFFTILFFTLASSSVVIEHDSAMMSESLSISSTVFLFGSAVNLYTSHNVKSPKQIFIFTFGIIWFMSTKATNTLLFIPLTIVLFLVLYRSLSKSNSLKTLLSFSILGFFLFLSTLLSDGSPSLNTSGVINNRLIYVPEWKSQLINSEYPIAALSIWEKFSQENLGMPPDQAVVLMPEFRNWWENGGSSYLLRFTIRNIDYALFAPIALPVFDDDLNYKKTLLSGWSQGTDLTYEYSEFKNSVLTRTFYWPDSPENAYFVLSITFMSIGICLIFFNRFNFSKEFNLIFVSLVLAILWSYINWWFGSKPADMARHNLGAAIFFKIIAIYAISVSLDRLFKSRK